MEQCCNELTAGTFLSLKDDIFKCFEEEEKLKTFYHLLRTAQPHKKNSNKNNETTDKRCFCEKKRAAQAEKIKRENELRYRKELLLLQCMCASMGPVKEKLKECNNKEEVSNVRDKVLKQCLCSAIGMILKTTDEMTVEKKKCAENAKKLKACIKARQAALFPENAEFKKCFRQCTEIAREECRKKFLCAKNKSHSTEEHTKGFCKCLKKKKESDCRKSRDNCSSWTSIGSTNSRDCYGENERYGRKRVNKCKPDTRSRSRSNSRDRCTRSKQRKNAIRCRQKSIGSSSAESDCYLKCKQKCDKKFHKNNPKCRNSSSSLNSRYGFESDASCKKYKKPKKRKSRSRLCCFRRSRDHCSNEQSRRQLNGGCDENFNATRDKKKRKFKSSASTDSTKSTRFRGRWFFRGKTAKSCTDSSFIPPPKSSLKTTKRNKNLDDKKQLRFNSHKKYENNSRSPSSRSATSSERSIGDSGSTTDHKHSKMKRHKKDKFHTKNDCLATHGWSAKSPVVVSSDEIRCALQSTRQKGGETDTDQKSKKNQCFLSKLCNKCKGKSNKGNAVCSRKPNECIGLNENPDPCANFSEDPTKQQNLSDEQKNSCCFSTCCKKTTSTSTLKSNSCHTLMSDLSLTKVYNDLLSVLRPDLLGGNEQQQSQQHKEKPKKSSPKRMPKINAVGNKKSNEEVGPRPINMIMHFPTPFPSRRNIYRKKPRKRRSISNKKFCDKIFIAQTMAKKNLMNKKKFINSLRNNSKKKFSTNLSNNLKNLSLKLSNNLKNSSCPTRNTGCYSCGNRKVRVNYIAPERWAALKSKLKIPKDPIPLPCDFVLDTNLARVDREVERCRDLKRQRQLEAWCKDRKLKELKAKDPFCTPAMNRVEPEEEPKSQMCYICKPVPSCCSTGGGITYECSYCDCDKPCHCAQNQQSYSKFIINNKQDMTISEKRQNIQEICTNFEPKPISNSPSTHPRFKTAVEPKRKPLEPHTPIGGGKKPKTKDKNKNPNKTPTPHSGRSKTPVKNRGKSPSSRDETPPKRKNPSKSPSSRDKTPPKRKNPSKSPSSRDKTSPKRRNPSKSPTAPTSPGNTPTNIKFQNRSRTPTSAGNTDGLSSMSEQSCKCCVAQCTCKSCTETSTKINIDRQRTKNINPASKMHSCYEEDLMKAAGCSCNLCNNGCCPFRVIEEHYYVSESKHARNDCQSDYSTKSICSQPPSCTGISATSKMSASSAQCSNAVGKRHSWCCAEDDLKSSCDKTELPITSSSDECDCKPQKKTNFGRRLDLVRDNCFKCPRHSISADVIDPKCKQNKLYLWVPDADCGENEEEERVCNEDGNFIEVIRVRSNELGFLANNYRQAGGSIQTRKCQKTKPKPTSLKSLKRMDKHFFCYKVRCEQKANKNAQEIQNCGEYIVKACQLRCKKTNILGPVKFKVCETNKDDKNQCKRKKYRGCHPRGCW